MWKYVEIWQIWFSNSNSWAKSFFFFSLYITNSTLFLLHSACSKLADDLEKLWLIKVFCASLSSFHTKKKYLEYLGRSSPELLCLFPQSSLRRCIKPLLIPFTASSTYLQSEGSSVADILISWVNIPRACLTARVYACVCVCCRPWRVQRQAMSQQRVVCTRRWQFHLRVRTRLHWCPVWDRWAGFFTAPGKVGISLQRKYFLLLSTSNSVIWQMFLSKEFPSLCR